MQEAFTKFKRKFERHNDCNIKTLVSKNCGEYIGVNNSLDDCGISPEKTAPYKPKQNGIAERMNRTLVEMVLTLLKQSCLEGRFWVEALRFAVNVKNLCKIRSLDGKTSFEILTGPKTNFSKLRICGSRAFVHVPAMKRRKLQENFKEGILL